MKHNRDATDFCHEFCSALMDRNGGHLSIGNENGDNLFWSIIAARRDYDAKWLRVYLDSGSKRVVLDFHQFHITVDDNIYQYVEIRPTDGIEEYWDIFQYFNFNREAGFNFEVKGMWNGGKFCCKKGGALHPYWAALEG